MASCQNGQTRDDAQRRAAVALRQCVRALGPQPLVDQLAEGGRLVIPVGIADHQELLRIVKSGGRTSEQKLFACRFVPLVGRYGWR